jgi:hypothetical protein
MEKANDGKFFMDGKEEDGKLLLFFENAETRELKELLSGEARNKLKKNCKLIEKLKTNSEDLNRSTNFKAWTFRKSNG